MMLNRSRVSSPSVPTDTTAPIPSPTAPPRARADQAEGVSLTPLEQQVSAARTTAREQIVAGQRQRALDTVIRGLALDQENPELNRSDRRADWSGETNRDRGAARPPSFAARFRRHLPRSRRAGPGARADRLLRAGDRVAGIRAAWAAAALYNKAPEGMSQTASASPQLVRRHDVGSTRLNPIHFSSLDSLNVVPVPVDKPASPPPLPPTASKGELPSAQRDSAPDPRAADLAAVRETLRRYTQAYQSLDGAAVGKMMPSLTAAQLRDLTAISPTIGATASKSEMNALTWLTDGYGDVCGGAIVRDEERCGRTEHRAKHLSPPPERTGLDHRASGSR